MTTPRNAKAKTANSEAAEHLRALWEKQLVPTRHELAQAIDRMYLETLHRNIHPDTGSALARRFALVQQHLELLVRKVVAEFKQEAVPDAATARFLAADAETLLNDLIEQAMRSVCEKLERRPAALSTPLSLNPNAESRESVTEFLVARYSRRHFDRTQSKPGAGAVEYVPGIVALLEQVARTEIRALKSSAKFARPESFWTRRRKQLVALGAAAGAIGTIYEYGNKIPVTRIITWIKELLAR